MRLATFADDRIGVVVDDAHLVDVSDLVPGTEGLSRMRRLLAAGPALLTDAARLAADGPRLPLAEVRLQAPVPDPSKVIAAPVNYVDHREEMKLKGDINALGFFLKAPSSVIGHGGTVRLPFTDRRIDHEAEFALVIGRTARNVTPERALDHVAGYTALIDVTMRGTEERSMRKSYETFTPIGPWIVTPDELGDPDSVGFTLWTNDEVRQKGNTRDLIWSAARFVAYASSITTLLPGDVISTGTPAGVSPIVDGDTVTMELERVGRLAVAVTADGAVPFPFPADPA